VEDYNIGDEVEWQKVRREKPKCNGIYIEGSVQGVGVFFTVDTGATRTFMSKRVYERIPLENKPELITNPDSRPMTGADGTQISRFGKAVFKLELGPITIERAVIVADIEDDVLIGADILIRDPAGPADLLLSQSKMIFHGNKIPLIRIGTPYQARRVVVADHFIIPALSERIIDCFVEPNEQDDLKTDSCLLVENNKAFTERTGMLVAPCLVNAATNTTVRVRVLNPFKDDKSIKQDTAVGMVEGVAPPIQLLAAEENPGLSDTFDSARRLLIKPPNDPKSSFNKKNARSRPKKRDKHNKMTSRRTNSKSPENGDEQLPSHLVDLFERSSKSRSHLEKLEIKKLLIEFQDVFSKDDDDVGRTTLIEHTIETGDARPVKQLPRRVPIAFQGEEKDCIEKLLRQGTIRPSTSPWASPLVLVRKKDGSVRTCVDYRILNKKTLVDSFPMPRVADCLDALSGSTIFSTMDVTSAFNNVPIHPDHISKTSFCSKYGLFEYVYMPFGMVNSGATFQRLIEMVLGSMQWHSAVLYLDDIICHATDFKQHLHRLREIFLRLREAGLKLKPKKCSFFQSEVTFLGHVVDSNGIRPNPDNVSKLVNWPVPKNQTEVRGLNWPSQLLSQIY
jgi:hypothetical protein